MNFASDNDTQKHPMHQFVRTNYFSAYLHETLPNGAIYQANRRANNQSVFIFELHISTLSQLQNFINKFVAHLILKSGGEQSTITDWHADLSQNTVIFAVPLEQKAFTVSFIEEIVESTQEIPVRVSTMSRNLKKIELRVGDNDDTPQEVHLTLVRHSETEITYIQEKANDAKPVSRPVEMQTLLPKPVPSKTPVLFDVNKVKDLIQIDLSTWKLDQQDKNYKVYVRHKGSLAAGLTQGVFQDGDGEIFFRMNVDLDIRRQWDKFYPKSKRLQVHSEKEDVVYFELKMPFPLSDRDLVLSRYYLNSDDHAEEIEKLGFPKSSNKRWIVMQHSVKLDTQPPVKGLERAELYSVFRYEQDRENPKTYYNTLGSVIDLKGNIPVRIIQNGVGKNTLKGSYGFQEAFYKNRHKWSRLTAK